MILPLPEEVSVVWAVTLKLTVRQVRNESLSRKSVPPEGHYGYVMVRDNKIPVAERVPISYRQQIICLWQDSSILSTVYTHCTALKLLEWVESLDVSPEPSVLVPPYLPVIPFTDVQITTRTSDLILAELFYHYAGLCERPSDPNSAPIQAPPPEPDDSLDPFPDVPGDDLPIDPANDGINDGGDWFTDREILPGGWTVEGRDVVNGSPGSWTLYEYEGNESEAPFVFEEPVGNGQCFKQIRTEGTNRPISPGGNVPCDTWQVEIRNPIFTP